MMTSFRKVFFPAPEIMRHINYEQGRGLPTMKN